MLEAGSVYVTAGAKFDDDDFRKWDSRVERSRRDARDDIEVPLKGDFDGRGFDRYRRELDTTERRTGRFRTAVGVSMGNVRGYVAGASAAGVAALGALGLKALSTSNDIGESLSKNRALFGEHADGIDRWSKRTGVALGVSRRDALESAGAFGSLFETIGLADQPAAKMSKRFVELAADLASFSNASPTEALEALRSGLVGEAEPMRRFGALLSETRVQQEAYTSGIAKAGAELTEQEKVQARYNLILKDTKQSHGDAEKTGDMLAGSWRRLKARASDVAGELGLRLVPYADKAIDSISGLIDQWRAGDGTGGQLRRTVARVGDAIGGTVDAVKDGIKWFREHKTVTDILVSALGGLAAGFVALKVAAGAKALYAALVGIATSVKLITLAIAANPIGALAVGLIALGTALVIAYKRSEKFRDVVDAVFDWVKGAAMDALDAIIGVVTGFLGGVQKIAELAGKIPGVGGKFKELAKNIGEARKDLDGWREGLRDSGKEADRFDLSAVREENRKTGRSFRELAKDADLDDVRKQVTRNMARIKDRLGEDSREGRAALARNFDKAQEAVARQMQRAGKVTAEGTKLIRSYLVEELQLYGFSLRQARSLADRPAGSKQTPGVDGGLRPNARGGRGRYARGGWLGNRGQTGPDSIEFAPGYIGAPGEAMLMGGGGSFAITNDNQIPYVEHAMAVTKALGLGPFGDLDELFAGVSRPHGYAAGGRGIVPVPGFPGERANANVLDEILGLVRRFPGLVLTDAFGPNHKSPGHTIHGTAADFWGPDRVMDAAVRHLTGTGYLVGYDGRFGSADWPGHGPAAGQGGGNAHLHVEFGGAGRMAPLEVPTIPGVSIVGGGATGRLAGRALSVARGAAQTRLQSAAEASLTIPVGGGTGGGGVGQAGIAATWRDVNPGIGDPHLMSAIAMAESSGVETAHGPPDGRGWYQIEWPIWGSTLGKFGNPYNGRANTRMAREVLKRQGLGAWVVYNTGAFRKFMRRGGRGLKRAFDTGGFGNAYGGAIYQNAAKWGYRPGLQAPGDKPADYRDAIAPLEDWRRRYEQVDRGYGQSEEELVNPDTGQIDPVAIAKRSKELGELKKLRERIRDRLIKARNIAKRVRGNIRAAVRRLERSLNHARKKDRGGITKQINTMRGRIRTWNTTIKDLGFDIRDARMDVTDVANELAEVAGTQASGDGDGGDSGGGGGGDESGDLRAVAERADQRAAALEADLGAARANIAAFGSPGGDLGTGLARSAFDAAARDVFTRFGAGSGVYSGGIGGGLTAGAGAPGGAYAPTIVVNPQVLIPGSAESLAAIGGAVAAAFDSQGYRSSNVEKVG